MSIEYVPEVDSAQLQNAILLRQAYVDYFEAVATSDLGEVHMAAGTIAASDAPWSDLAEVCARAYEDCFFENNGRTPYLDMSQQVLRLQADQATTVLAPIIRSYAFSGLAFQAEPVLRAAQLFGKDAAWAKRLIAEQAAGVTDEDLGYYGLSWYVMNQDAQAAFNGITHAWRRLRTTGVL
jgi:hypothetical protein